MRYKLIIGLGNPGKEYENTYHNVGLMGLMAFKEMLDAAEAAPVPFKKYKGYFEYAKYGASGEMMLVRPLVFMNESGAAVKEAMRMANATPEELLVLHDDSDLALDADHKGFKLSTGQGAAGHHGIESIIAAIGSKDFARARIGIRPREELTRKKAGDFVLKSIDAEHRAALETVFREIWKVVASP